MLQSSGGGEPRSSDYWLVWNTCAEDNQSVVAAANGGRAAGWVIMDDLLADPGVLIGAIAIESCAQGVTVLQQRDTQGVERQNDVAYVLAAQLLAAQLNLAAGSEYCPASDQAISEAQLLLLELSFDATSSYLSPPRSTQDAQPQFASTQPSGDQIRNH
jgi:hypothetical protein